MGVLNIAGYRFVDIDDGPALRATLLAQLQDAGLLGTVLIAPEGINLVLAGARCAVLGWLDTLRADPRFTALRVHAGRSDAPPFARLLVKCKAEIIRMNQPRLRPAAGRAPAVSPRTLARWLAQGHCDAGRPLVLLDTRNAFEVDAGGFHGAADWRLSRFSDFPAAFDQHRGALAGKTVVSYCTGGIRCEKAALLMQRRGQPHVWQLDGGILGYFAAVAAKARAAHWHGGCVVFDSRGVLDPAVRVGGAGAGAAGGTTGTAGAVVDADADADDDAPVSGLPTGCRGSAGAAAAAASGASAPAATAEPARTAPLPPSAPASARCA